MTHTAKVFLIRHGEKDPKLPDGEDPIGLSKQGLERAQGLIKVFGKGSPYDLGLILTQHPKKDGKRARPYDTVKPLVDSLGHDVKFNSDIDRDDAHEVAKTVRHWDGKGNILICWEHGQLHDIAKALGIKPAPEYPDCRFDLIWIVPPPYDEITSEVSEDIPGLDDKWNGK